MAKWNKSLAAIVAGAIAGVATAFLPDVFDSPSKIAAAGTILTTLLVYGAPKNG